MNKLAIPIAIIAAGALIGAALFLRGGTPAGDQGAAAAASENNEPVVLPVSPDEHILGNPEAPIVIVEYSDTECPFCKQFHTTMHRIIDEYGREGQVAWVYRHFPLESIHSKAPKEAEATECAAEIGGNTGFWSYIDRLFEITPSNDGLDLALLPQIAEDVGLDRAAFEECLDSGRYAEKIQDDFEAAVAAGGRGTPHNVILAAGNTIPLEGAQPYASVKAVIDSILEQLGGAPSE